MKRCVVLAFGITGILFFPFSSFAAAAGPDSAGAGAETNSTTCLVSWVNTSNVAGSDNSYVTANNGPNSCTNYLVATNFGFSIPSDATITGIELGIERYHAHCTIKDHDVHLVKGGSVNKLDDKASNATWPLADAVATYGGSNDLWNESWTPSDINASNFGAALSAIETSGFVLGAPTIYVDNMTITVYYTESSGGGITRGSGGKSARLRRMQKRRAMGLVSRHDTEPPSLSAVGIFDLGAGKRKEPDTMTMKERIAKMLERQNALRLNAELTNRPQRERVHAAAPTNDPRVTGVLQRQQATDRQLKLCERLRKRMKGKSIPYVIQMRLKSVHGFTCEED